MHRLFLPLALLLAVSASAQDDPLAYQTPAPELAALVDAPRTPAVSLSPDRSMMALLARPSLPPVAELAEPELGLAGIRVNPRTNGPSRASGFTGVALQAVDGDGSRRAVTGFPDDARIRSASWSPDGIHMAALVDRVDRIDLYVVDVRTGTARRALDAAVNDAAPGASYRWLPSSDGLVVRTVLSGRGAAPAEPTAPEGPVVQESMGQAAPARTFQDLLEDARDEALFDHYMTSEIVAVGLDGST
ncbi:MAG: S9 family peptidase, partial [Bacteroidota bacterium]